MTNEEVREGLRLLLELWEQGGQEACETLLALEQEVEAAAEEVEDHLLWREQ